MATSSFYLVPLLIWSWVSLTLSNDYTTQVNYTQILDHFKNHDKKNQTFLQRVFVDDSKWSGTRNKGSIFVLLGGDNYMGAQGAVDVLNQCATQFGAMIVYIEHRFYGNSIPLESTELAMKDREVRECLTVEQSLEDFKEIILSLKFNYSAHDSPVVVVGPGYGGVLAAFFRLKYPKVAVGALASSAPIIFYGNVNKQGDKYCSIVSKSFKDINQKCYHIITQSWKKIDQMASQTDGLQNLSKIFKTCRPLQSANELKQALAGTYSFAAQYVNPVKNWIVPICKTIAAENSIIGIANSLFNNIGSGICLDTNQVGAHSPFDSLNESITWEWQQCKELVLPISCDKSTMLPRHPFNLSDFTYSCRSKFGVTPIPNSITAYFGCKDIKETLLKFGSNIIFSNGLKDPVSSGGILENISDTILAVTTTEGTHLRDLSFGFYDDPTWLKEQRQEELRIMARWINHEYVTKGSMAHGLQIANPNLFGCCLLFALFANFM